PHGEIMRKITGAFRKKAGLKVALVFLQTLISIDYNFMAKPGNLRKNLLQNVLVEVRKCFLWLTFNQTALQSKIIHNKTHAILFRKKENAAL
ncbi:MAG: hypothetical protein PHI13_12120, partial [Methylococcales bacterium]|nr:hypothetical protein [Methylococcales bacterium]